MEPTTVPDGAYAVRRTAGLLPPRLEKRVAGGRGWTLLGPLPLLPFRLEPTATGCRLVYRGPLRPLVDDLVPVAGGAFEGRARVAGVPYGRFRLEPRAT